MTPNPVISIIDTTLRDGLQHEERYFSLQDRLEVLQLLIEAGLTKIEVGSFAHPLYQPQFREIDKLTLTLPHHKNVEYTFLALNKRAVERVVNLKSHGAPVHRVLTGQIATSVSYARKNMNRSHEELFDEAERLVDMLHEAGISRVAANVGTIFGCPIEGKVPLSRAYEFVERLIDMGFDEIEHSDPDGAATPDEMAEYCGTILRHWPDPSMHVLHVHDIYGMGLSSYYAALKQGIRRFECTLGGIGGQPANVLDGKTVQGTGDYYFTSGRTGLVSIEDFSGMLSRMNYTTGINLESLAVAGRRMEELLGRTLGSFVLAASQNG